MNIEKKKEEEECGNKNKNKKKRWSKGYVQTIARTKVRLSFIFTPVMKR